MPLTPAETETAYRLILERTPAPAEIAHAISQHDKLGTLRHVLLNSEEFYKKIDHIRNEFTKNLKPVLVDLHIPGAVPQAIFELLTTAETLQPATDVDTETFAALCARPRPERLKLRYIYGDLAIGAGEALRLPYVHLCIIARPGPRIYRLYCNACGQDNKAEMDFGTYLEYSLNSVPHRLELDNGQLRRLSGERGINGFGREPALLASALHNALAPTMILGFAEYGAALIDRLIKEGALPEDTPHSPKATDENADSDSAYAAAVEALNADRRAIFDAYIAWDSYLYEVCKAVLLPSATEMTQNK